MVESHSTIEHGHSPLDAKLLHDPHGFGQSAVHHSRSASKVAGNISLTMDVTQEGHQARQERFSVAGADQYEEIERPQAGALRVDAREG
jgi:hypothetical protein